MLIYVTFHAFDASYYVFYGFLMFIYAFYASNYAYLCFFYAIYV